MHSNAEQRELIVHIGSLQKALDKPKQREALSLAEEESFHIMDIREELCLPNHMILAAVNEDPWIQTVESHLVWKKQLLEDITTKQIDANIGKEIQRTQRDFVKEQGPAKYSKEESTEVELGEIKQETVVGFCIQDLIPSVDHPHPWDQRGQEEEDPVISRTITFTPVYTLLAETNTQFGEFVG